MPHNIHRRALELYQPPFRYFNGLIYDHSDHVVANDHVIAGINGWGRLQNVEGCNAILTKVGEMIAEALTEYWTKELKKLNSKY